MKKILVVDDDLDILEAVQMILVTAGYTADITTKGDETYEKVNAFRPDLIILDVLLSGNDGRIICQNLKQATTTKAIPIIMISAHPTAKDSVKQYGADGFLAKPFSMADLLNTVKTYIG